MIPGLDPCSTYTDPAEHLVTAAVASTVPGIVDGLDRDLSEVGNR